MRSLISLLCLLHACLSSVEAFFPYKITHGTNTTPAHKESMANYIQKGFTFTGIAEGGFEQAKLAIKKRAVPSNMRPVDRSISENRYRRSKLHGRKPSSVQRDDNFKVASAPAPSQTNSLTILDDGTDFSYYATVSFGSSQKELQLLLDSGAANTWVMGSDCTTKSCETHSTYGPADSTTLKATGEKFAFTYGSGQVSGVVVTDDMTFAGHTISLAFGTASQTSNSFEDYPMDGILGLGRDASNAIKSDTFMETVATAKIIPAKQYGMSLQRESGGSMYGEINFGAPDTSKYDGDLQFTDTISSGSFWEIPCDDIIVDGTPTKLTGNTAIIDSGTTYILIPPADAKQLHAAIPGSVQESAAQWNIPCNTDLDIQFVFSGKGYSVSPKDYVGPSVGGGQCDSHFVGTQGSGPDQWIVGDVFMKNVYTLFDFDEARIGFGVQGSSSPSSSAAPSSSSSAAPSTAPASSAPSSSSPAASSSAAASAAASTTAAASSTGSSQFSSLTTVSSSRSSTRPTLLPPTTSSVPSAAVTTSGSARATTTATPDAAGLGASSGSGKVGFAHVGFLLCFCVFGGMLVASL